MNRRTASPREVVRDGDLINDNRLAPGAEDLLDHDAIARGVAEIALSADAPVNIALFGAWGSGKSSVYSMITEHLQRVAPDEVRVARYDAWKYGGQELKRNFIDSLSDELDLKAKQEFGRGLEQEQSDTRLRLGRWVKTNWRSLLLGVLLAAIVAGLWVMILALAAKVFTDVSFGAAAASLIPQAGTVFGLSLVATLIGPKALEGAVITTKTPAPEGSDQFAKRFRSLVEQTLRGKPKRLIVFIDELDRCSPDDVVATLIDLKTFLDQEQCAFIVAADREVLERALDKVPQAKPVREDEPYYATSGAFLDKIFQHQIALPPLRSRALTRFARDLVDNQGGLWEEMRRRGQDLYEQTIFALVPVHVRSPRRVKVLLNTFGTQARVAQSRGLPWLDRAQELAVLTVLQTEFPSVADDLRRVPRLLVYLRGEETPTAPEVEHVVARYRVPLPSQDKGAENVRDSAAATDDASSETAAGRLLTDDDNSSTQVERGMASRTLRRQLTNYLEKVKAVSIRDPRPDLLYLQVAGSRESLADPRLGDAIDYATDTAPDAVVAQFAGEDSATLGVAIPLLVSEGDNAFGPGQLFAYEAACKLIERVEADQSEHVAREAGPSLIAAGRADRLTLESVPGMVLVALWANNYEDARASLENLRNVQLSEDLLTRLASLLPELSAYTNGIVVEMLADRFLDTPEPLLSALSNVPIEAAVQLWEDVKEQIIDVLNTLELSLPNAPAEAAGTTTATTASTRAAATATPAEPEATGVGIARMDDIVTSVTKRPDHEPLLSVIFESAQTPDACEPLRLWAVTKADELIATMDSSSRRAHHALLGLRHYAAEKWPTWASLLSGADSEGGPGTDVSTGGQADDTPLATAVLRNILLPAANTSTDTQLLAMLPDLAASVARRAEVDVNDLTGDVSEALNVLGWEEAIADDAAGTLLWSRKTAIFNMAANFAAADDSPLYQPLIDDLVAALINVSLPPFVKKNWLALVDLLPAGPAERLSGRLDEYEPSDTEIATVLEFRLAVRAQFGGSAPAAANLIALPEEERTTEIVNAWLGLRPPAQEVRSALEEITFVPSTLRSYCNNLDVNERTATWVALFNQNSSEGLLTAAGAAGVGSGAVDSAGKLVAAASREPERAESIRRLQTAQPYMREEAQVKKAASELAELLLDKGTYGDLRSAADLVLWAGGAGYGSTQALRQKFIAVAARHDKNLPKTITTRLSKANLFHPPEKGFIKTLLGG